MYRKSPHPQTDPATRRSSTSGRGTPASGLAHSRTATDREGGSAGPGGSPSVARAMMLIWSGRILLLSPTASGRSLRSLNWIPGRLWQRAMQEGTRWSNMRAGGGPPSGQGRKRAAFYGHSFICQPSGTGAEIAGRGGGGSWYSGSALALAAEKRAAFGFFRDLFRP